MTTSSSPLEQALQSISGTGWLLKSLGRSMYDAPFAWWCELYPGHFGGSYFQGTEDKAGGYTVYKNAMTTVLADGRNPVDAVMRALKELDKSPAKAVYEDLERALEDWMDAADPAGDL